MDIYIAGIIAITVIACVGLFMGWLAADMAKEEVSTNHADWETLYEWEVPLRKDISNDVEQEGEKVNG